jgi:hypothetical protein
VICDDGGWSKTGAYIATMVGWAAVVVFLAIVVLKKAWMPVVGVEVGASVERALAAVQRAIRELEARLDARLIRQEVLLQMVLDRMRLRNGAHPRGPEDPPTDG